MRRPNLAVCSRREATEYIKNLEERVADLDGRLSAAVKGAGDDALPGARSSDPATSHNAAVLAYPRSGRNRWKCLTEIAIAGERGLTQDDVVQRTGINGAWKRLSELLAGGWIMTRGTRKGRSGTDQRVYVLSAKGYEALRADGSAAHIVMALGDYQAPVEQEA